MNYQSLRDKLLSGYAYWIKPDKVKDGERAVTISTGVGGVNLYLDACQDLNIPFEAIKDSVKVEIEGHGLVSLNDLKIKNLNETT